MQPSDYILELDPARRPSLQSLPERVVPDIDWYNANRASQRRFHPTKGIEGLVIHATAGGTSSGALSWWKIRGGAQASAHWIIPGEQEPDHGRACIAAVYESLAAWHVQNSKSERRVNGGRALINHWSLGIEIVNRQTGADPYSDWQVEMTARIARYCWAKYPNFKWIFSHAAVDSGRRTDPGKEFPWARFVKLVQSDSKDQSIALPAIELDKGDGRPCCL